MTPACGSHFDRLLREAEADPEVVGLILGGSRGKNAYVTARSDHDVYVIVASDQACARWAKAYPTSHGDPLEVMPATLDSFREHARPGSPTAWNAYTFAHVEPVLDKLNGEIATIAVAKGRVDPASAGPLLDEYINLLYRSAKSARDGLLVEARFDAAESVSSFLDFLFAVHGRVRPYNKWLRWELEQHPLETPWTIELVPRLERVLNGDRNEQASLFRDAEALARRKKLGDVVEGWEPDLSWLRGAAL